MNTGETSGRDHVAVVVPLGSRPGFDDEEEISLRHLEHFLGAYDRYFVAPPGMAVRRDGYGVARFEEQYFGSGAAHARLQFSIDFYKAFQRYRYILMYHLDALVFRDELVEWCTRDYDFIGAPWYPSADTPWVKTPQVGNSGFALLRVEGFLRLLKSKRRMIEPRTVLSRIQAGWPWRRKIRSVLRACRRQSRFRNNIRHHITAWLEENGASDIFWARQSKHYDPDFKIASPDEAVAFAIETDVRACYRRNGGRLPFGCHAWTRYDRAFWEPHLLR